MIIDAWLQVIDYEDSERLCERHGIQTAEVQIEEDYRSTTAKQVSELSDAEVARFLIELALIRSGFSSAQLAANRPAADGRRALFPGGKGADNETCEECNRQAEKAHET